MRVLAIGDLVGENGVKKLKETLPKIREQEKIDFVIVNAENSAGGMGITTKIFNELKEMKVDAITMGNHTWGKRIYSLLLMTLNFCALQTMHQMFQDTDMEFLIVKAKKYVL